MVLFSLNSIARGFTPGILPIHSLKRQKILNLSEKAGSKYQDRINKMNRIKRQTLYLIPPLRSVLLLHKTDLSLLKTIN